MLSDPRHTLQASPIGSRRLWWFPSHNMRATHSRISGCPLQIKQFAFALSLGSQVAITVIISPLGIIHHSDAQKLSGDLNGSQARPDRLPSFRATVQESAPGAEDIPGVGAGADTRGRQTRKEAKNKMNKTILLPECCHVLLLQHDCPLLAVLPGKLIQIHRSISNTFTGQARLFSIRYLMANSVCHQVP